jgi:hypothetical protein
VKAKSLDKIDVLATAHREIGEYLSKKATDDQSYSVRNISYIRGTPDSMCMIECL